MYWLLCAIQPKDEDATPQISRVRALYDFQPTEQGELGFEKGDIIRVIESVYRDWWKGELRGKTGIFPVNYVEKIVDPSPSDLLKEASVENEVMNETRNIDRLLEMLSSNDPRAKDSFSDNEELQNLYNSTLSIRPKLVKLIEKYSLKKGKWAGWAVEAVVLTRLLDELVALNEKFMQARTMYDGMLSNSIARYSSPSVGAYGGYPPSGQPSYDSQLQQQPQQQQQQQQQPQQQPYGGYGGYQPYPAQPYGGYQPSPSQPQQQQQQQQPQSPAFVAAPQHQSQSPAFAAAPQHQTPTQQPTYAYNTEATPQVNNAVIPQQQQQPQYDYNAAIPQQQQQQQPQYDYNAQQSPYQSSYDNQQQQQQQQPPPTQQQQQYVAPQTTPGYPGQPQQAYNY